MPELREINKKADDAPVQEIQQPSEPVKKVQSEQKKPEISLKVQPEVKKESPTSASKAPQKPEKATKQESEKKPAQADNEKLQDGVNYKEIDDKLFAIKEKGNIQFKKKAFKEAIKLFSEGIKLYEDTGRPKS